MKQIHDGRRYSLTTYYDGGSDCTYLVSVEGREGDIGEVWSDDIRTWAWRDVDGNACPAEGYPTRHKAVCALIDSYKEQP